MLKADVRIIVGATLFMLVLGVLTTYLVNHSDTKPDPIGSWACTADAQLCPDGSSVGRIPPYCQFAPCP